MQARYVTAGDFYEDCTLTAEEWLERKSHLPEMGSRDAKWRQLLEAYVAARPLIGGSFIREEPRVGYSPESDSPYFLFKIDNNGDLVIVSAGNAPSPRSEEVDRIRNSIVALAELSAGGPDQVRAQDLRDLALEDLGRLSTK